ncbi:hypothetical protein F4819DRAFT_502060 [Hypoxylon fuscum]|nr:hypothetical protein F4819DRAFT_502060 [Hypoxylon fuscum]
MCLFPYPVSKSKKSRRAKNSTKRSSGKDIQEFAGQTAGEAFNQGYPHMSYSYWNYPPYMEQRLEDEGPNYITKRQWASHEEALKGTFDAAQANGKNIDEVKAFVSGGVAEARDAAKDTQTTIKETYDAIKKSYDEHSNKQDRCAAEIDKVRKHLEDEARKREETHQKQQSMQEAWNYFQWLRQAERDAQPKSSRSSIRSEASDKSKNSDRPRRRRTRFEDPDEPERQRRQDRELKKKVLECLNEFVGEARQPYTDHFEGHRENHNRFYDFAPAWDGQYQYPHSHQQAENFSPYPGPDGSSFDNGIGKRGPPRRPHNPFLHDVVRGGYGPRRYM